LHVFKEKVFVDSFSFNKGVDNSHFLNCDRAFLGAFMSKVLEERHLVLVA